jgi:hypothetical protein
MRLKVTYITKYCLYIVGTLLKICHVPIKKYYNLKIGIVINQNEYCDKPVDCNRLGKFIFMILLIARKETPC